MRRCSKKEAMDVATESGNTENSRMIKRKRSESKHMIRIQEGVGGQSRRPAPKSHGYYIEQQPEEGARAAFCLASSSSA